MMSNSYAVRIRNLIAEGDYRNAAGFAIYEVFGPQKLGKTKRAQQCAELQDNFTLALENLREHLISRLREVSIYEGDFNDEREVEPVVVYMRCLEALGVDVDREAEHVRQVMRDAIAKPNEQVLGQKDPIICPKYIEPSLEDILRERQSVGAVTMVGSVNITAKETSDQRRNTHFVQSCEHGKLSGNYCRNCKRSVPYGEKP